jgi:predicted membrane protein
MLIICALESSSKIRVLCYFVVVLSVLFSLIFSLFLIIYIFVYTYIFYSLDHRQSKYFFDLETKVSEALSAVAMKVGADSEVDLANCAKQLQLCDTYSSTDSVIQSLIDNNSKDLGKLHFMLCMVNCYKSYY